MQQEQQQQQQHYYDSDVGQAYEDDANLAGLPDWVSNATKHAVLASNTATTSTGQS